MKIGMRSLRFFILLFAASSLLFQFPPEAFAATSNGSVDSTKEINDFTCPDCADGPVLGNSDYFGSSVANIGDLDGNGVNDLAVGASHDDGSTGDGGTVHIIFLNSDGTLTKESVEINDENSVKKDHFGRSVANMGDLDGDGVNDLAVGAEGDDASGYNSGTVHIIFMYDNGTVKSTKEINETEAYRPTINNKDNFGFSVANIGDLDGNGVNDLAVGAYLDDMDENGADNGGSTTINRGAVHIIFLNSDGTLTKESVEINDFTANGPDLGNNDRFGASVANIGDLDGNGVNDLAVGAFNGRGAVHIIFLNSDGALTKESVEINDSTTSLELVDGDNFGYSVANMGDLDGDGVNDLAVGARGDHGDGNDRGAVHIIFMNTNGSVDSTKEINDTTANGPDLKNKDYFGGSVANIGDLNGNGVNDLAVGAIWDDMDENEVDTADIRRGTVHILFLHETTKPTVTITSTSGDSGDTVSSTTLSYTATFSESTSNFVVGDITVTGTANVSSPEASNFAGSGTTYTFDVVQGSSDGTVLVSVAAGAATDAAENDNTASNTYTLTINASAATTSSTCTRHVILGNCGTIAINNDEYRIIHPWSTIPTTEVMVGEPVSITLSTPHNYAAGKINSASVYTEIFGSPTNYELGSHIDYSVTKRDYYVSESELFQVAGATHRIVQDPDVKNLEMFEVVFTMVFAKPMDTSHIVVETKNMHGIPETIYLGNALKVIERPIELLTMEEKSKFKIISEPELKDSLRPGMDPEPDMDMLVVDPELVVSKATCGKGTMLKDNLCVPNKMSFYFFVNQFMRLFG